MRGVLATLCVMSPLNRKAGARRLVNMSAGPEPQQPWAPDLPPDGSPWEQTFPLSEDARYVQRLGIDETGRLVEWAVIQMRRQAGKWRKVAVYDISHGKGVHVHLFNRQEVKFTEMSLRPVSSYEDVEAGLDYALKRVTEYWLENERRSDRGY